MKYKCKNKKCKHNVIHAGDSHLMNTLPFSVTSAYPVHCRFIERNYHLSSAASFLLESTMVTYGSGEHVMKCLLQRQNSLHNDKIHRFADKVRLWQIRNKGTLYTLASNSSTNLDMIPSFIHLMTQYSTFQVPSGKNLRQLYVKKADSKLTPYGVSDNERFTREIQAVGINQSFAQDHTFEGTKNWQKSLGAKAIWDVSNELGEICSAVLVPSQSNADYAHAVQQMLNRDNISSEKINMFCDTWPSSKEFWTYICPSVCGKLGLWHFIDRITRTLRKNHINFPRAMKDLQLSIYSFNADDESRVIMSLKTGRLNGTEHTDEQVANMRNNYSSWNQAYSKYIQKIVHPPASIAQNLTSWHIRYKVEATPGKPQGTGRLDPNTGYALFTADTRSAVDNAKSKAEYITDPHLKYRAVQPPKTVKHDLVVYKSLGSESKIETYHPQLANYANTNCSAELADALGLAGTAQYNRSIQERIQINTMSGDKRSAIPYHLYINPP